MNYSVKAGGKRLRPLFMQEICRLFTGEVQPVVVPFMAAIEMIHTSSWYMMIFHVWMMI